MKRRQALEPCEKNLFAMAVIRIVTTFTLGAVWMMMIFYMGGL